MDRNTKEPVELAIGHVLFIDIVGYSKLLTSEQRERQQGLNRIVRETEQFRAAEAAGKLVRVPTGDGMVLAFFTSPEAPLRCAVAISHALHGTKQLPLRMGIHSGPVDPVEDVNDKPNLAGAGVNLAQRVMNCGDAGHILLSARAADDLAQHAEWKAQLHEIGEAEVKHGVKIRVVNFFDGDVGNSAVPEKILRSRQVQAAAVRRRTIVWSLGIIAAVAAIAAAFWIQSRRGEFATVPGAELQKSIAVLPFENLSAEKDDAFFADGIQDDVLASLGKIKDLKVIARSSVMIYRGVAVAGKLREIGQALRVSYVLQGSVRRGANRVVINVALINTGNDNQVWSQHYDRTLNDMLSLQGEVAVEIARELQATLTPDEKTTIATKPTKNPEAYVLYLKALDRDRRAASREDGIAADQLYTQAIGLDPTFALAVARASIHNSRMYLVGGDPTRKAKARAQAEEAVRLSPSLGEAQLALALCFYRIDKNYEAALQELSKAAANSPNDPEILDFTGGIYLHQGHWREALANFLRAQELDPNNPYADKQDRDIAGVYTALRDWPAAAAALQRLRQIAPENEPDNVDAQVGLAYVEFFRTGSLAAGKEILHKIPAGLDPNAGVTLARWDFSMLERDFTAAEKILAEYPSEEFPPPMRTPKSYFQGLTALAQGDAALAQTLLEKARPSYELGMQNHPDDPRFLARLATLYAYLGRKEEAIRAARRAVELLPQSKDAAEAPSYEESLAGVYARTGEADQAIVLIEQLLMKPGGLILAELRLRWQWDPLRNDPRFKKILSGPEPKTVY